MIESSFYDVIQLASVEYKSHTVQNLQVVNITD